MTKFSVLICLWLACGFTFGQNYNVKKYSTKDGLFMDQTMRIFQDPKGFLWISYISGNWQIFDDKKFTTIQNKGSYFFDSRHFGDNVYTWAHFGYFHIKNYKSQFYPLDTAMIETYNRKGGYSNLNARAFDKEGNLFILKLANYGELLQNSVHDTLYKVTMGKVSKISISYFKNDSTLDFKFFTSQDDDVWIAAQNTKTYKCEALFRIVNNQLVKESYSPPGEISTLQSDKNGNMWILFKSPNNKHHYFWLVRNGKVLKEFDIGLQESIYPRLKFDNAGVLWAPNLSGLIRIDPSKNNADFFVDKGRRITVENTNEIDMGEQNSITRSCDRNNYAIEITRKNEVLVGNKIFTPEQGFKTLLDNSILGPGALRQIFQDAEENLWYVGNGLIKLTPSVIETLPVRAKNDYLFSTNNGNIFSTYLNEVKKKNVLLVSSEKGTVLDSIFVDAVQSNCFDFFDTKDATIITIWRSEYKREFLKFSGKFSTVNSKACETAASTNNEVFAFVDKRSEFIYFSNDHVYKLKENKLEDITSQITSAPKFIKPSRNGHWQNSNPAFFGILDSLGIYEFDDNRFTFTPFKGFYNSGYGGDLRVQQCRSDGQQLIILALKSKKIFVYRNHKIKEVQLLNVPSDNQFNLYPSISSWINDSVLLASSDETKLAVKFSFSYNFEKVKIENVIFKDPEFETPSHFFSIGEVTFARPNLRNIHYFYSDSLTGKPLTLFTIPNSAMQGNIWESNFEFFDRKSKKFYFRNFESTFFIDLQKVRPNLKEPFLNIYQVTYNYGDTLIDLDSMDGNVELPYNFNPLKIYFRGICTTDGMKVKYKYFLEGLDSEWQETLEDFVTYSSLPPMVYKFKVIACNNDGIWNKTPVEFKFNIPTPWWKTWWFYLGLAISVIFMIVRSRTRKLRKEKQNLENVVKERTAEVVAQKHFIEEKHKEITDSIDYAERIQRSFLASKELLDQNLKDYFILFQPKDVVSGDFYWASLLTDNRFALVTADSTGHGVPGAIMSILNIFCLEKAVEENINEPSEILNHTRLNIIKRLKMDGSEDGGKDGMDCCLIVFDFRENSFTYSAANNPVWIVRNEELIEFASDKMPVGKHDKDASTFTQHTVTIQKGDMVYAITDGMPDQFGGPKGKKFMYKQVKELLIRISVLTTTEQKEQLAHALRNWKGDMEQVDDITVIGIRV